MNCLPQIGLSALYVARLETASGAVDALQGGDYCVGVERVGGHGDDKYIKCGRPGGVIRQQVNG